MNSMFQDSKISLENLKLYRETPEEELVKNVNPFEQRQVFIRKRNGLKNISPELKSAAQTHSSFFQQQIGRTIKSVTQLPAQKQGLIYSSINTPLGGLTSEARTKLPVILEKINHRSSNQASVYMSQNSQAHSHNTPNEFSREQKEQIKKNEQICRENSSISHRAKNSDFIKSKYDNLMKNTFCLRNNPRKQHNNFPSPERDRPNSILGIFLQKEKKHEDSSADLLSAESRREKSKFRYEMIYKMMMTSIQQDKSTLVDAQVGILDFLSGSSLPSTNQRSSRFKSGNNFHTLLQPLGNSQNQSELQDQQSTFEKTSHNNIKNIFSNPNEDPILSSSLTSSLLMQTTNISRFKSPRFSNHSIKNVFNSSTPRFEEGPAVSSQNIAISQQPDAYDVKKSGFFVNVQQKQNGNKNGVNDAQIQPKHNRYNSSIDQKKETLDLGMNPSKSKKNIPQINIPGTLKNTQSPEEQNEYFMPELEDDVEEDDNEVSTPLQDINSVIQTLNDQQQDGFLVQGNYGEDGGDNNLLSEVEGQQSDFKEQRSGGLHHRLSIKLLDKGDGDEDEEGEGDEDGDHGFILKKNINFDQLKELRNKTINRINNASKGALQSPVKLIISEQNLTKRNNPESTKKIVVDSFRKAQGSSQVKTRAIESQKLLTQLPSSTSITNPTRIQEESANLFTFSEKQLEQDDNKKKSDMNKEKKNIDKQRCSIEREKQDVNKEKSTINSDRSIIEGDKQNTDREKVNSDKQKSEMEISSENTEKYENSDKNRKQSILNSAKKKITSNIQSYFKKNHEKKKKSTDKEDSENKEEVQRQQDKQIASKLEEVKDKVRMGVKVIIREEIQKRIQSTLSQTHNIPAPQSNTQTKASNGIPTTNMVNPKSPQVAQVINSQTPSRVNTPQMNTAMKEYPQQTSQFGTNNQTSTPPQTLLSSVAPNSSATQSNNSPIPTPITKVNPSFQEQQKEVHQYSSAIMTFFNSCIDNLNEKESSFSHDFQLRNMKNFNANMSESISKTFQEELKRQNVCQEYLDRFKYIYEINAKMHILYQGMVVMVGGIDKVKELIEQVVKKVSSHVTLFPINHVYSFDIMHRRIIPGICALLCDDHRLFIQTLHEFLAENADFSFIDFFFIKKKLFSLLTKEKQGEISTAITLSIMQKIESIRRYVFPIGVLSEPEIRQQISQNLFSCQPFMALFQPNEFKIETIRQIIDALFDFFYSDSDDQSILDFSLIRKLLEHCLVRKLSRKIIDYIEVYTQKALQEDRFTLNVILRDLHYKFTKVRLKLGFRQNIFGIFKFENNQELLNHVLEQILQTIEYGCASYFSEADIPKLSDIKFLKHYMRFLISEYDIFSVYDFSVAMPYFGVTLKIFRFWMSCLRTVLLTRYNLSPQQVQIFIRFAEACCPTI